MVNTFHVLAKLTWLRASKGHSLDPTLCCRICTLACIGLAVFAAFRICEASITFGNRLVPARSLPKGPKYLYGGM